jgi:hypothetical protein
MLALKNAWSAALVSAAILMLPTSEAQAQSYDRDTCLLMAKRCAENYEAMGFQGGAQCWDATFAENCPGSGGAYDPTQHDYSIYYGTIQLCYGPCTYGSPVGPHTPRMPD